MNGTDNTPTARPISRRVAYIGAVISAALIIFCLVTMLSGCLYEWADKDCAPHGGVAKVRMLGNTGIWKAKCNDGTVYFK